MKTILEYEFDGAPIYLEVEDDQADDFVRSDRGGQLVTKCDTGFKEALAVIKPAANAILVNLNNFNKPNEITIDFGLKFNAKIGVVFSSVDSEATFKISLKWNNK
jgi:hypothetical protein